MRSDSNLSSGGDFEEEKLFPHPVEPRSRTAMLPPVLVGMILPPARSTRSATCRQLTNRSTQSKIVDKDPLCWLEFTEDSILTSCKSGKPR